MAYARASEGLREEAGRAEAIMKHLQAGYVVRYMGYVIKNELGADADAPLPQRPLASLHLQLERGLRRARHRHALAPKAAPCRRAKRRCA